MNPVLTMSGASQSLFFLLPAELRNTIYEYTLCDRQLRLEFSTTLNQWVSPALCRVNKQIREEALAMYYSHHSFVYELPCPLNEGIRPLLRALDYLHPHSVRFGTLTFLHVNTGVQSMLELTSWVRMFVQYRSCFPERIGTVYWPIRGKAYALDAAKGLCDLANDFSKLYSAEDLGDELDLSQEVCKYLESEGRRKSLVESLRV